MQSFTTAQKSSSKSNTKKNIIFTSLIARQYLMQFCPDAEYRKSKITLNIAGDTFITQAQKFTNSWKWKEVLGKEDDTENQEPLLQ